ncbi:hypothetical protein ACFST9_02815 [Hymenobacter monticola]|uniref:DUF255 domain-containing protein n=1 Tax=Hymenobacter monticola TaxID=1705399 RepID=A0ABY4B1T4_9BACT|nr:hypothetical protein [Hymenobacter monticola]UOE33108.1 hypothetical protein MTP16_18515 [Hymenobacter monticola]
MAGFVTSSQNFPDRGAGRGVHWVAATVTDATLEAEVPSLIKGLPVHPMKQLREQISEAIILLVVIGMVFLGIVLLIPIIPFFMLHAHFSDKQFEKDYSQFLERMAGACFFCYNSRKSSVEFARDVIVPELATSVHIVFVNGKEVEFGADSKYISRMLYDIKERKGFPYLLKIEDGQVANMSVNNQFYSIMIGRKPIEPLLDRMNTFFASGALKQIGS